MKSSDSGQNNLDLIDQEFDREKTFFQVSWKSLCYFCFTKRENSLGYLIVFLIVCYLGWLIIMSSQTLAISKDILGVVISVTTSLLGFLIAGFSIYTALSDKDLVYILMNYREKMHSQFHINNLYFYEPFVFFGLTFCISLIGYVIVLIWDQITIKIPLNYFFVVYGFYFFLIFLSMVSLKDFIYNVYTVSIMMGRIEYFRRKSNMGIDEIVEKMNKRYSETNSN